jgi:hypothetical protein
MSLCSHYPHTKLCWTAAPPAHTGTALTAGPAWEPRGSLLRSLPLGLWLSLWAQDSPSLIPQHREQQENNHPLDRRLITMWQ